ncbi:MAG: 50S ribosomal protein L17 [Elusimicrobia bacterium]|nr:50S ribosomal protein L17 [Elusimicrobiota bacterium]
MKNRKNRKIGRTTSHRFATLRSLSIAIIENESIKVTLPKAKELVKFVSKIITKAKKGGLSNKRLVAEDIKSSIAMTKLFGPLAERFKDRPGGYTRIYKLGRRISDGSEMAIVKLVE